jgi:diguanylate cyclase
MSEGNGNPNIDSWNIKEVYEVHQKDFAAKMKDLEIERLKKEAETDTLTGFLNHLGLVHYQESLKETPVKFPAVFCAIDLDNLRRVNNKYGHEAGNEYILSFVKFTKKYYPNAIAARRTKGDEFGLIFEYPESVENSNFNEKAMYSLLEEFNNEEKNENKLKLTCGFSPINSVEDFWSGIDKADKIERKNKRIKKNIFRQVLNKVSSSSRPTNNKAA